jgi:hypothetical protein
MMMMMMMNVKSIMVYYDRHCLQLELKLFFLPLSHYVGSLQLVFIIIISLLMSPQLGHRPSLWLTHTENRP